MLNHTKGQKSHHIPSVSLILQMPLKLRQFSWHYFLCCSVLSVPRSDLKKHDEHGKCHSLAYQGCVGILCKFYYTIYRLEFALKFHKRLVAFLVCEQIFILTETSGFLGPHPNTAVKVDQKEILVNYKASIHPSGFYEYICDDKVVVTTVLL